MRHIAITVNETAYRHALIGKAKYLTHQSLPHGIDDYLPKPVKLHVLKEILDKWMKLNKENQLKRAMD